MGVELFDRRAELVVAPIDGSDGIEVSGLRVTFRVEKTSSSESNTATIGVYNLAEFSRGRIKAKDQAVVLRAGYVDLVEQVCAGVIKRVEHRREGVDTVTEIEIKDGGQDLLEPEFRRSYAAGTSRRRIIADILSTMTHTTSGTVSATGVAGSISGKMSFATTAKLALDRLARAWDFEWSIQDGAIQIIDADRAIEPVSMALKLTPDTGLLGSPARTGQEGRRTTRSRVRRQQSGARFRCLLMPSLRPGRYVLLESELVSGAFKVQSVDHQGDTHGNDWTTEVEAVQL
jgi:hypothetical protein